MTMEIEFIYGLMIIVGLIVFGIGIKVAKDKGYIGKKDISLIDKAAKLTPVIVSLIKKFDTKDEKTIEMIGQLLRLMLDYITDGILLSKEEILDEGKIIEYANRLVVSFEIELSEEDTDLLEDIIGIIYIYLTA